MKKHSPLLILIVAATLNLFASAYAEETPVEKLETQKNTAVDAVKRSYRDTNDKACKMVHGKLECLEKKVINKTKNGTDKLETKATELKNKTD
jgi:hypothetical protein